MKMALIGGGGVRAPEFVRGALAFAADMDLRELWLMDDDPARLAVIAPLCEEIVRQSGSPLALHRTTDLTEALRDAGVIVTTIRVGQEAGRILDERIALRLNLLGQETTGPGGFAMAMRSIPALLEIARLADQVAPRAWTFNFTNPAGLVTQALHDAGFRRVVGICDSANTAQHEAARWLRRPNAEVRAEVYGLNHLSWTRRLLVDGRDVLPALLADDAFIADTHLRFFGPDVIRRQAAFLNEYLYYYYFRDEAVERIQAEELTRGEEVQMLTRELFEALGGLPPDRALQAYEAYNRRRSASYMAYAESDEALRQSRLNPTADTPPLHHTQDAVDGYAGVALRAALALTQDRPLRIGLNVPNGPSIACLRPEDVVEVSCEVDGRGIHPLFIGDVPEDHALLMQSVKRFERLAVAAVLNRDRALAVEALVAHPLVGSYRLARALVEQYLEAHRAFVGAWS